MSTPPFVDLPAGVEAARWGVRGSQRAVFHAGFERATDWAVLVPGFTGSKEDFVALLPLLAAEGMGVVTFDQLGQFESDGSGDPVDYALDRLASDVAEIADRAAERFGRSDAPHLMGHSFGGLVAQEAVAGGHLMPASMVLLCSGPGALPPSRWRDLPALVAALDEHDLATIWRIMRDMEDPASTAEVEPAVAGFLERRWHANDPVGLREFALLLMHQPDLVERMRPFTAARLSLTVIWGELDDAWPVDVQQECADRLGAQTEVLVGLGHSPNAQDPEATARALLRGWGRAG